MTTFSSEREPVEKLAEEFIERFRRGEKPTLDEYVSRYPQWADPIRALFPTLLEMEQLASLGRQATGPHGATLMDPGALPERLGEYRILREIGHGGMGIVYEAVQETLGRHVALKVLPLHGLLNPTLLERFKREARAAAKLHHTNIVPVFGVGEDGGIHYFAMQYISGQGLDKVLDEVRRLRAGTKATDSSPEQPGDALSVSVAQGLLSGRFSGKESSEAGAAPAAAPEAQESPSASTPADGFSLTEGAYFRSVARAGVQVAEALAYAHRQGVLHRDLKPSNLLLDAQGTVWITDFGLAKMEDSDNLTDTGDVVGTLRYLAPERLEGRGAVRSEVYGVGVTLYEMLTLRPAFPETDRLALLQLVRSGEPPRPRRFDGRIPRDLETIVLKALAKEPARRYQTATELAEDLKRYVSGEPIRARRISVWQRVLLWARRRPAAAGLLLVSGLAVLAVAVAAAGLLLNAQLKTALQGEAEQRQQAERLKYYHLIARAQADWRDGNLGSVEQLLNDCPPEQRAWEWHFLQRQCHTALFTLADLPGGTQCMALSPDGSQVAAAGDDDLVRVWDLATGQLLHARPLHDQAQPGKSVPFNARAAVTRVAYSPDGTCLAAAYTNPTRPGRNVAVWEVTTGQLLLSYEESEAACLAFSPDGKRLAANKNEQIVVWDLARRQRIRTLHHPGWLQDLAFSPDGTRLASTGFDGTVHLWDARRGMEVSPLLPLLAPTPVLVGLPSHVVLANAGIPRRILAGHTNWTFGLAFSPDGTRLASNSADGTVRLWDPTTGQTIHVLRGQAGKRETLAGEYRSLAFGPDGKRLAFGESLRVWDTTTGQELFKGHTHGAWYVAFSPDGTRLISNGGGRSVQVSDATTDPQVATLAGPSEVHTMAFSPDGRQLATASEDQHVRFWDLQTGQIEATWKVWDSLPGEEPLRAGNQPSRKLYPQHTVQVTYSPDGQHLATTGGKIVKIWNLQTRQVVQTFKGHTAKIRSVAFNPKGTRLASSDNARTIKVWDVATGEAVLTLEGHEGHWGLVGGGFGLIPSVEFSPDGTRLASGGLDGTVMVWHATTGTRLHTLKHSHRVWSVAFNRDGTRLAAGAGDGKVRIWDTTSGQEQLPFFKSGMEEVFGVAFSPDGNRLASTTAMGLTLWDAATGQELLRLEGHNNPVWQVAFSPDGKRLATASWDKTVRIWDARPATSEGRSEREATSLLAALVAKPLCHSDIRDYLGRAPALSAEARQLALSLLNGYREETDPERYHQAARELVQKPYLNAIQYGFALRQAKTACRLAPEQSTYRTALGAAQYRVGQFQEAVVTLTKAAPLHRGSPADQVFLAMAQHRLEHKEEAEAVLARLRETLKAPPWANNQETQALLREAEALIAGKAPDPKK